MSVFYREIETKAIKRDLMLRFTFLLSIFMILLSVSYVIFSVSISENKDDSILLDIMGRQRMKIYQYASEVNLALVGLATSDFEMALTQKKKVDITMIDISPGGMFSKNRSS